MIDLRGLPRTYWLLWTGALINRLGGFVMPLLALYLTAERGLRVEEVGLVISLFGGGALLAGPAGGFLADRLGRKRTLSGALVAGALAMLHLALARAPLHIAAAAFLLGFFGEMYRPAVSAAIADVVPARDRARAYGLLYWAVNLGFAVGSALGGAMSSHGWYLLFAGDAATTLVYAGVVWLYVPETRPAHPPHHRRERPWTPLADRPFVAFCLLMALVSLLFHQAFVTLPLDVRAHGLSPASYGSLIALNGVLIFLLQPPLARALAPFPRHRVLSAAAALVGIGFGMTALVHSIAGYVVSITVWSVGEIVMAGLGPAVAADAAPAAQRGAYQGVFQMSFGLAALGAPLLGSFMLGRFGSAALWGACLAAGLAAAAGQLALGTLRRHGEPAADAAP
ncbi:MAG TPA: MFS transporter [Myxococcales bacterium]|nr:MFS transporter [Myxococcales bacterium]